MANSRLKLTGVTVALSLVSCFGFTAAVGAIAPAKAAAKEARQSTKVQTIISAGDTKIANRLASLDKVSAKMNTMTHLKAEDKAVLQSNITLAHDGLVAQKSTLDAATTVADATTARNQIFTNYRVYAVVLPQVHQVKVADDQLTREDKLTDFATKLSNKVAGNSGLQATLADMQSKISAARTLTTGAKTKALAVKPADYNADRTILKQNLTSLKQAQSDNKAAYQDGLAIMKSLK